MTESTLKKIALWACGRDTGLSSTFLASCVLGGPAPHESRPYDADDFGRCYRFSKLVEPAELKAGLDLAATITFEWSLIRDNWAELSSLFEKCFVKHAPGTDRTEFYKRFTALGL